MGKWTGWALLLVWGTSGFAKETYYEKIQALFASGTAANLSDFLEPYFAWGGKCVRSREPSVLYGGAMHGFTERDPLLGDSTLMVPFEPHKDENYYLNQKKEDALLEKPKVLSESENYASVGISNQNSLLIQKYSDPSLRRQQAYFELKEAVTSKGRKFYLLSASLNNGNNYYCYFTRNLLTGENITIKPEDFIVKPKSPQSIAPMRGALQ